MPADDAVLLAAFRDSLQQNFGDHGLGSALASLQGEQSAAMPALLPQPAPRCFLWPDDACCPLPPPLQSSTTIPCPTCVWCAAAGTSTDK